MASRLPIVDPSRLGLDRDMGRVQRLRDGSHALQAGDTARARALFESLQQECAVDPDSVLGAQASLFLVCVELLDGAPADALARLEALPDTLVADRGFSAMLAATALRRLGRLNEALEYAERAVEHGVKPGRLLVLADAQKHAGMLPDAIATLERLLADEPKDATALGQLAGYLYLASDRQRGVEIEERFEACAPQDAESDRARAFIALTRADLDAALASLERAFTRDPKATLLYVRDEVELLRYADDARVKALRSR